MNIKKIVLPAAITAAVSILATIAYLTIDMGWNGEVFAKRNFQRAMDARMMGDCDTFLSFVSANAYSYFQPNCKEEKDNANTIISYTINKTSIANNTVFLSATLTRQVSLEIRAKYKVDANAYTANYEMRKINGRWLIDKDIK